MQPRRRANSSLIAARINEGFTAGALHRWEAPAKGVRVSTSSQLSRSMERDFRSLQVLIVEDNHDAADGLARLVRLGGHQVQVAYSGAVGLLIAQQQNPDVILLDIGLPRVDGYQVIEKLRARPETKDALIVAVTGYGQASDRQRSRDAGFDLHLVKPIQTEKLLALLRGDPSLLAENAG